MAERLKLKAGAKVPFPERLYEGYELVGEDQMKANVSVDKIADVMRDFIKTQKEPIFFFLELPPQHPELAGRNVELYGDEPNEVYYMDGARPDVAIGILDSVGTLLVNDGLEAFGYGNHINHDEIMFSKYNVTNVYSRDIWKYAALFEAHKIEKTERLVTASETFSQDAPGSSTLYEYRGKTVYDIPKFFAKYGLYRAKR